jgi:hypothetical protein
MTAILDKEWRGVLALIWLACGLLGLILLERYVDAIFLGYFDPLCVIALWITTFRLAISGIRNGNNASRICGALSLLVIVAPVVFILVVGYQLSKGH